MLNTNGLVLLVLMLGLVLTNTSCKKHSKFHELKSPVIANKEIGHPTFGFPRFGPEGGKILSAKTTIDKWGRKSFDTLWSFMGVQGNTEFVVDTFGRLTNLEWIFSSSDTVEALAIFHRIDTLISSYFGWTLKGLVQDNNTFRFWYTDHGIYDYHLKRRTDTLDFRAEWYDTPDTL
jgi:hypothetical protein